MLVRVVFVGIVFSGVMLVGVVVVDVVPAAVVLCCDGAFKGASVTFFYAIFGIRHN